MTDKMLQEESILTLKACNALTSRLILQMYMGSADSLLSLRALYPSLSIPYM